MIQPFRQIKVEFLLSLSSDNDDLPKRLKLRVDECRVSAVSAIHLPWLSVGFDKISAAFQ